MTEISCHSQQVVFHKYFSLFLLNNIIVMVFHAVISIHLISIVYLTQIVTGIGKSKKKIISQKYFQKNSKRRITPYWDFLQLLYLALFQGFRGQLISVTYMARRCLCSYRMRMRLDQEWNVCWFWLIFRELYCWSLVNL